MAVVTASASAFNIGPVITRTFDVVRRNLALFLALSLLFYGLPQFLIGWAQAQFTTGAGATFSASGGASQVWLLLLAVPIAVIGGALLQGALCHAAIEDLNGRSPKFGDCAAVGLRLTPAVIAINILIGIGVGLGFLLFIVPGFILAVRWIAAAPARVAERPGIIAALARSAALTKGSRWRIFGLALAFWIAFIVAYMVFAVALGVLVVLTASIGHAPADMGAITRSAPYQLIIAAVLSIANLFTQVGATVIYVELRALKEGGAPASVATVFD